MKKPRQINLVKLNSQLSNYLYNGYDLHFIHGWLCAYLSAPSDSEEDLLLPMDLVLNEATITDEAAFSQVIDQLLQVYAELSNSIYEQNKLLRPLIDLATPGFFDPLRFNTEHQISLLIWLYGYLSGYFAIANDATDYITDAQLLDSKFYPALFTLCVAFIDLAEKCDLPETHEIFSQDFNELRADVLAMWESAEGEQDINQQIIEARAQLEMLDIIRALNDIFYVIRVADEVRFSDVQGSPLLKQLAAVE